MMNPLHPYFICRYDLAVEDLLSSKLIEYGELIDNLVNINGYENLLCEIQKEICTIYNLDTSLPSVLSYKLKSIHKDNIDLEDINCYDYFSLKYKVTNGNSLKVGLI